LLVNFTPRAVLAVIDRMGQSLIDLLSAQHLDDCGVDLYLDQQNLGTTRPMGRPLFHVTGAFAEFERSVIKQRVWVGLNSSRALGAVCVEKQRHGTEKRD
jgi:DNA invertase Pin-like site-specific DNA recombinase